VPVLPVVVAGVSDDGTPDVEYVWGTVNLPKHSGLLGSFPYHGFAASLNDVRANEVVFGFERGAQLALAKAFDFQLRRLSSLPAAEQLAACILRDSKDSVVIEPFIPFLDVGSRIPPCPNILHVIIKPHCTTACCKMCNHQLFTYPLSLYRLITISFTPSGAVAL
jgi:hypothetical protein